MNGSDEEAEINAIESAKTEYERIRIVLELEKGFINSVSEIKFSDRIIDSINPEKLK